MFTATSSSLAPSDSFGNVWTPLTGGYGTPYVQIFYAQNYSGGSNHTFTLTGGAQYPAFCVMSWSGMATSSVYETGTWAANAVQPNPLQAGSVTPTYTGHNLFIAAISGPTGAQTYSINGSFSTPIGFTNISNQSWGAWMSYFVQAGGASQNPSWSSNDPYEWSIGAIAVFKGAN
jgi:hypothetical protein